MRSFFSLLCFKGNSPLKQLFVSLLLTMLCCGSVHAAAPSEVVYSGSTVSFDCFSNPTEPMDDCKSDIQAIPSFAFNFFGVDNTHFFIGTNGFIHLATTGTAPFPIDINTASDPKDFRFSRNHFYAYLAYTSSATANKNDPLPPSLPTTWGFIKKPTRPTATVNAGINNLIAPFWDDLKINPENSGTTQTNDILYQEQNTLLEIGDVNKKQLIVQWINAGFYKSSTPLGTFQAILYENTGGANPTCDIRLQYRQLAGSDGRAFGNDATIGLQGPLDVTNTSNNTDQNRSLFYSYGSANSANMKPTTIKPLMFFDTPSSSLKPLTLDNNKAICFKWDATNLKYNISLEKYDPVFLYKTEPPPAIPKLIYPTTTCPVSGETDNTLVYRWGAGSYRDTTVGTVTEYQLKVAEKPDPMPATDPDNPFNPFATLKLLIPPFTGSPLETEYSASSPNDDLDTGRTYYVAVVAKNVDSSGKVQETWSDIQECKASSRLSVAITGTGTGTVSSSSPTGINCSYDAATTSGTCKIESSTPSSASLIATPGANSYFQGWSGDCNSSGVISLTKSTISTCTATFTAGGHSLTVDSKGTGTGQITSSPAGISCLNNTGTCSTTGAASSTITLGAVASSGSTFSGWSGDCNSSGVVTLTKDSTCTATFSLTPIIITPPPVVYYGLTIKHAGTGKGTVTGTGSLNCVNGSGTCYRSYTDGTSISLTATPDADSEFAGWSSGCSNSFGITENMTCTATFNLKTFAVTITKPTNGKVSAPGLDCGTDCSENISPNDTITLTAAPDPGFAFAGWSGDCAGSNPLTLTVDKAKNCQAIFVPLYKLTVSAPNGSIKTTENTTIDCGTTCSKDYAQDTLVKLQATPQAGYEFTQWTGDCSGTTNPLEIKMNTAKTCQAAFTLTQRLLQLNLDKYGSVSGAANLTCPMPTFCNASYPVGEALTLTATATSGYAFTGWSGDCSNSTNATIGVTMDTDKNCQVHFVSTSVPILVIAEPTKGKVTGLNLDCGTTCSATYPQPTSVELTAIPESGYTFTGWTGDCSGTANPLTINVDSAKNCTANFALTPVTLTLTPPTHGKISAPGLDCGTTCSQPLPPGTEIPLTATPEPGYIFTGWSGDCAGTENPLTVTIDKAKNCVANFAPISLPILVVTNPTEGTVTGSGIECGTTCTASYPGKTAATLTATPSPGYKFTGWSGDCTGTANPITLEVDSGKKCTANFEPILVPLNVSKPTNGKVNIPGLDCSNGCSANLPQNSPVTISAIPDPGFVFAGWSGDCAGTTNPLTLTLNAAKNCTPIFAPADKPMIIIANPTQGKVTGDEIDCGTKCTKTFPAPTTMTLTATPEPGFVFTGWSGDCSGTANPLTIEISKAKSCKANFAPVMLPVTLSKPANGKVSAPSLTCDTTTCNGSYPQNSTVTLTAIPDPGFVFVGWSGDCSGMTNPLTIQIDKAKNCQANFIPVTQPALIIPELTKGSVSGEGISPCSTACAQSLPQKQTVTLTATPEPGYIFTGWSGDCSGMTNPITVEIDKATTCIPTFTPAPLVVKISQPLNGKVAGLGLNCGDDCTENYPYGSNLTLTATPEDGYVFVGWSGSCSGMANPITVQAELAAQCIPLFAKPSPTAASPFYALMVGNTETAQGTVTSQPQAIDCGQDCYQIYTEVTTVTLTATPTAGFRFRDWQGHCQGTTTPVTLEINAVKTCQARFEPVEAPPMQPSVLDITLKVGETQQHPIQGGQNPRTVTQLPDSTLVDMLWDSPVNLLTVTGKQIGKTQLVITDALQRTAIVNITVVPGCRYNMIGLTHKGETVDGGFNCITPQVTDFTPKCRINAVGIDKEGKPLFSHSCFTNHVKTRAARPFVPDAYPMTQVLDFSATITVDPRFIGQKAEVLMVAYSAIYGRVDAFMRDGDEWVAWDNKPINLKSAQLIDKLPSQFDVSIYNGNLSDLLGAAEVYVGYRLENGDIYYNGVEPIRFQIGNSASVDPALNTEKNVNSNEVNAGSYFEPVTGTQDGLQNNHQIFTNREALSLVNYLLVDKKHVGQVADILMVAVHQPYANPAASYQRIGERWELWDEKISSLQPAQHYDQLPDNLEIPIYMGSLAEVPGEFTVYVGYRLSDNTIIFNGLSPHHFAVANALGRDKDGNPTKPTARFVNSVNYLNMIHSSGRVTAQDDIGVYSSIWVDPKHIGQKADILMAMLRSEGDNYQSYQRNLDQWELWDEQQVSLKATIPNVTLEPLMKDLQLFAGQLQPDDYLMYIGYRLPNGEVIYNGGEVIHIKVSE